MIHRNGSEASSNEKMVMELLLTNARITDSEISSKVGITPQAVGKIRRRLEERYIQEYRTIIDYESIGLRVFAIAQVRIDDKKALDDKHIIGAFEINESSITHIFILGFSSVEKLDEYKEKFREFGEIKKIHVISRRGFLKNSPVEIIKECLSIE